MVSARHLRIYVIKMMYVFINGWPYEMPRMKMEVFGKPRKEL